MKKVLLTLALVALLAAPAAAAIDGSAHDLAGKAGMTETRICVFCHTPHFALAENDATAANYYPLWNRMDSAEAYDMYNSLTLEAAAQNGTPQGPSKLCLSCHDGSVAVDSYGANFGTTMVDNAAFGMADVGLGLNLDDDATANIGMKNDHPVGVKYSTARTTDTELRAPADAGPTGTQVSSLLWQGDYVECSSCHDVHNGTNLAQLLTVDDSSGSALCLTCHAK